MRGTYFLGNGAFETRDIPEHPLAPREVLIQVAACGVCGTDVHIYHGDKGSAEVIPPVVLGHHGGYQREAKRYVVYKSHISTSL